MAWRGITLLPLLLAFFSEIIVFKANTFYIATIARVTQTSQHWISQAVSRMWCPNSESEGQRVTVPGDGHLIKSSISFKPRFL